MERWRCVYILTVVFNVLLVLTGVSCADNGQSKDKATTTQCWECMNYDPKGNFYDQCPMNGTVDPVRAYIGNCTGKCFTHTDDRNNALVVRGCTSSQWGLPDPLPEDGCYPWYSEVWCVCSSDGCNGVALGKPLTDKEFDAHIDYNKRPGDDDSGAAHLGVCFWTSNILLVATSASVMFVSAFSF